MNFTPLKKYLIVEVEMKRLIAVLVVCVLLTGLPLCLGSADNRTSVAFPLLPSTVLPASSCLVVLPLDESMDSPTYFNNGCSNYSCCVLDEHLELSGPFIVGSDEYYKATGFERVENPYHRTTRSLLLDESNDKKQWFGFRNNSASSYPLISFTYLRDDKEYEYIMDDTLRGIAVVVPHRMGDYHLDRIEDHKVVVYRKLPEGEDCRRSWDDCFDFMYYDYEDDRVIYERNGSEHLFDSDAGLIIGRDEIIDLKEDEIYPMPQGIISKPMIAGSGILSKTTESVSPYSDNSVRFFITDFQGNLLVESQVPDDNYQNRIYTFSSDYVVYRAPSANSWNSKYVFRVFDVHKDRELIIISDDDIDLVINGNYIISLSYEGVVEVWYLPSCELVKRMNIPAVKEVGRFDRQLYAVDVSHPYNQYAQRDKYAFAVREDMTFDYTKVIPARYVGINHNFLECEVVEFDGFFSVRVLRNSDDIIASFPVPTDRFTGKWFYFKNDRQLVSCHENGLVRVVNLLTGEMKSYSFEPIDKDRYKILTTRREELKPYRIENDSIALTLKLEDRQTRHDASALICIDTIEGSLHMFHLNHIPTWISVNRDAVTYRGGTCYNEKGYERPCKLVLQRFDRVQNEYEFDYAHLADRYCYIDEYEGEPYNYSFHRLDLETEETAFDFVDKQLFPSIDSELLYSLGQDCYSWDSDFSCRTASSMVNSIQFARIIDYDNAMIYQDKVVSTSIDSKGLFTTLTPCQTFAVREVERDGYQITFEFTSTRCDTHAEAWSGVAYLTAWGHKEPTLARYYTEEYEPTEPVMTELDSNIESIGPLLAGESQKVTLRIPDRDSVLMESDLLRLTGEEVEDDGIHFLKLAVYSNGVLDFNQSDIPPCNRYPLRFSGIADRLTTKGHGATCEIYWDY